MTHSKEDFNNKTILITGGAGFIGSNLAFYFQRNYPESNLVVFDCFRNEELFSNGNLQSLGHYKNLIGFQGDIICGDININSDLKALNDYKFDCQYDAVWCSHVLEHQPNPNIFLKGVNSPKGTRLTLL